jgi:hypothetical protein
MVDFIQPLVEDLEDLVEVLVITVAVILRDLDLNQHQLFMEPLLDMEILAELLHIFLPINVLLVVVGVLVVLAVLVTHQMVEMVGQVFKFKLHLIPITTITGQVVVEVETGIPLSVQVMVG